MDIKANNAILGVSGLGSETIIFYVYMYGSWEHINVFFNSN